MLDNGLKYEEEIKKKFMDIWYDEKYQYYFGSQYREPYSSPSNGDYYQRVFVSLDSDKNIIGFISYSIGHETNRAYNFGAINFTDNKITFGIDLSHVIDDIFTKFNMNKVEFNVLIGNPIEKTYDKLIKRIGGRIVGIRKECAKIINGTFVDEKMYEIMRTDYMKFLEKRG